MKMEGVERSELRKLQKEQERERRRLRDRQRRQSMSVEEREKHLARRRRNYQLRRLRAGIGIAPSQSEHEHEQEHEQEQEPTSSTDQLLALPSSDPSTAQCNNDVLAIESHQVVTNSTNSESLEVPVHKLAQFSGQLRLNRVKNLARSLNGHVGDNHVMIKANEVSSDIMAKGLRLNRVKNLARSLNSAVKESSNQNHPRQIEGLKAQTDSLSRTEGKPNAGRGCNKQRPEFECKKMSPKRNQNDKKYLSSSSRS